MRKSKSESTVIELVNQSTIGPEFEYPLDQIKMLPEDYRHRDSADLSAKNGALKALKDSLASEGLQEPLIVYQDDHEAYVLITGHRRRAAIEALADEHVGNFRRDMPVKVRAVLNGSRHDFLLLSVADNVIREQIDELHRTRAAVRFINEGVDHARIKYNLRLSDSTFDRCRRLAANPWMLAHVQAEELGLTAAHLLLEAAGGKGGPVALEYLRKDLNAKIAVVLARIAAKRADLASRDKELKQSEEVVKGYFPPHTLKAWVLALKRGERIPREVKYRYGAAIETDRTGKKLVIPAVTLPFVEGEVKRLAEVVKQLDRLLKDAKPQVNALARQCLALQGYGAEAEGSDDFASVGLDAVDDLCAAIDSEATTDEYRRQEDDARKVVPATTGLEVADRQPEDAESNGD